MTVTVCHGELPRGHRGEAVEAPELEDCSGVACLLLGEKQFLRPQRLVRGLLFLPGHMLLRQGNQGGMLLVADVALHR